MQTRTRRYLKINIPTPCSKKINIPTPGSIFSDNGSSSSAKRTWLLQERGRPHITEPYEVAVGCDWAGHWRVQDGHARPALVEVRDAGLASNIWAEAWLDLPGLQPLPVD